jgi:hypothetical protein
MPEKTPSFGEIHNREQNLLPWQSYKRKGGNSPEDEHFSAQQSCYSARHERFLGSPEIFLQDQIIQNGEIFICR